jgi:hypothetical protein
MAKDMQFSKFWRAVWELPCHGEKLEIIAARGARPADKFIKRVTRLKALTTRYPLLTTKKWEAACGDFYAVPVVGNIVELRLPKRQRNKAAILLLIARYLDSRINANLPGRTRHGWSMCAIYMDLVRYGIGKDEADRLKQAFVKHHVRWKKPVKRTAEPTEAQLQARRIFAIKRKLYAKPNPDMLKG